ncbi:MAG: hypothetical protein NZ889_00985 [Candidatus Pacearchaeota archaeon]|nr:hypothetical protein [Candidatus Pacearchaeota archaeon]
MPNVCPWCGAKLEIKKVEKADRVLEVCARCNFKIKEYKKPEIKKEEEKPSVVEIKESEKPVVKEKPIWPIIAMIIALTIVAIILIKIFLV